MKMWTSLQKGVEKRINRYVSSLERDEEKEKLEHMVQCGSLLSENTREIEVYLAYKAGKSIPAIGTEVTSENPSNT